jgi:hypothetical protein
VKIDGPSPPPGRDHPPHADDYVLITTVNQEIPLDMAAHVSDPDPGDQVVTTADSASSGRLDCAHGQGCSFVAPGAAGVYTVGYTATDLEGLSASATIAIVVLPQTVPPPPGDHAPMAANFEIQARAGVPTDLGILKHVTDADRHPLRITDVSGADSRDVTCTNGQKCVFDGHAPGVVQLVYRVVDSRGASAVGRIQVDVFVGQVSGISGGSTTTVATTSTTSTAAGVRASHRRHDDRSSTAQLLRNPGDFPTSAGGLGLVVVFSLLALVLIGFPAELFNHTFEENRERIDEHLPRWVSHADAKADGLPQSLSFAVFVVISVFLYALLRPEFGDSAWLSLRVLFGLAVAIVATTLAYVVPLRYAYRRVGRPRLRVLWLGLVVAAACVALSREANFRPGYAYGLAATIVLISAHIRDDAENVAKTAAVAWMLALSVAAWIAWWPVDVLYTSGHRGWLSFFDVVLPELFVMGIQTSLFALVPLKFLPGGNVSRRSWGVWAVMEGIAAVAFVGVVLNPHTHAVETSRTGGWVGALVIFVLFGLASLLFWAYFAITNARRSRAVVSL